LKVLEVEGRIILKWTFKTLVARVVKWTDLSQDKNNWWAVVKAVMNFRVARKKRATIIVLRWSLLREFI
jgi:hypothetical protein